MWKAIHQEYIKRLKTNPIARKVKEKDLRHNRDLTRLPEMTENEKIRQINYQKALKFLEAEVKVWKPMLIFNIGFYICLLDFFVFVSNCPYISISLMICQH